MSERMREDTYYDDGMCSTSGEHEGQARKALLEAGE
jgi:hypothetical protein